MLWIYALCFVGLGFTSAAPNKRIIQGTNAKNGDVPWLVGLHFNFVNNPPIFCGGALIDDETVLTAAHCFKASKRPRDYTLIIGEGTVSKVKPQNKYKVSRIVIHSRYMYSYPDKTNDLAVLKTTRKIKMSGAVKPIDLPSQGFESPAGTPCLVAGWGRTEVSGSSWTLMRTKIKIADFNTCKKEYPGIIWSKPESQVCAGGAGMSNVCQGDSGGPMACQVNGRWVLEGAVSFGNKYCGRTPIKYPAVFTRISSFIEWIKYNAR